MHSDRLGEAEGKVGPVRDFAQEYPLVKTDGHVFLRTDPGSCKFLATSVHQEAGNPKNSVCVQFGD